jgi:hypothetical protein
LLKHVVEGTIGAPNRTEHLKNTTEAFKKILHYVGPAQNCAERTLDPSGWEDGYASESV